MVKAETNIVPARGAFPKMMVADDGEIVLFSDSETGTTIVEGSDREYKVGYFQRNWDIGQFRDFSGYVTLSNEG